MKKELKSRWVLILARALDHRIGRTDGDRPELPILTLEEAMASFYLRLFMVVLNVATCLSVMANVIRHWWN
jgi:hypothetical protein